MGFRSVPANRSTLAILMLFVAIATVQTFVSTILISRVGHLLIKVHYRCIAERSWWWGRCGQKSSVGRQGSNGGRKSSVGRDGNTRGRESWVGHQGDIGGGYSGENRHRYAHGCANKGKTKDD
jgi:hypothetical protein